MTFHYSFKDCLARSEKISWRVEDLINAEKSLDFARPFLPDSLAWVNSFAFLSDAEKLRLNQKIGRAHV